MKPVHVDLGPRSYDVLIGRGLLDQVGKQLKDKVKGPVVIIADQSIITLYATKVENSIREAGFHVFTLSVPSGERSKSSEEFSRLLSELAKRKVPRSGTIIAIGGGVIGDLAGFVAASYLRGITFIQVPTTLLAMVDSSVGGKTGINLPEGKNLVGAFYQPKLVVADLDTLKTLPSREFSAGMAEVIKYGAIKDEDEVLFDRVAKGVKPDNYDLDKIIENCVTIKADIVKNDEFETRGQRALLNFGHTLGHAIENASDYEYLHGEAIALGMLAATWLSTQAGLLPNEALTAMRNALAANDLPLYLRHSVNAGRILSALEKDKKIGPDGRVQWVLLEKIGKAKTGCTEVIEPDYAIDFLYKEAFKPKS